MASDLRKRNLLQFIEIYKGAPVLWKIDCGEPKDHLKREVAYDILMAKLKEVNPKATRKTVLSKISEIKSKYRKELQQMNDSMRNISTGGVLYKPTLWYFDHMHFLKDQILKEDGKIFYEEPNHKVKII